MFHIIFIRHKKKSFTALSFALAQYEEPTVVKKSSITVTTASVGLVKSFIFIAVSFCSSGVFSYQHSDHLSVNHLAPTGRNKVSAGKRPLRKIHHPLTNMIVTLMSSCHSLCSGCSSAQMQFQNQWNKAGVRVWWMLGQKAMNGVCIYCGSFSIRHCSGGAVGPRSPAGQLQPGKLHLPGHAAQHRQDRFCIQRGQDNFSNHTTLTIHIPSVSNYVRVS